MVGAVVSISFRKNNFYLQRTTIDNNFVRLNDHCFFIENYRFNLQKRHVIHRRLEQPSG